MTDSSLDDLFKNFKSPLTYAEQRRERLMESLSEYLDDDDVSLSEFISDIKVCMIELKRHHEDQLDKMTTFMDYLP